MDNYNEKLSEIAEKKVKVIYPDARVIRDGVMFFVTTEMRGYKKRDLGAGFSKEGAWCSAGCSIPSQKQNLNQK